MAYDDYWRCCCGIHVHTGSLIIGILTLANFLLSSGSSFGGGLYSERHTGGLVIGSGAFLVGVIASALLIVGNVAKKPVLYWPFLILFGIYTILLVVFCILSFFGILFYVLFDYNVNDLPKNVHVDFPFLRGIRQQKYHKVYLVLGWIMFAWLTYFYYYLLRVVCKGRQYLEETRYD